MPEPSSGSCASRCSDIHARSTRSAPPVQADRDQPDADDDMHDIVRRSPSEVFPGEPPRPIGADLIEIDGSEHDIEHPDPPIAPPIEQTETEQTETDVEEIVGWRIAHQARPGRENEPGDTGQDQQRRKDEKNGPVEAATTRVHWRSIRCERECTDGMYAGTAAMDVRTGSTDTGQYVA